VSTKISINIEITNKKSIYNKIILMRVIKLTESDLTRIVNKVLREQSEEPEKEENLLLALRNFAKGKLDRDDLYAMDKDIEFIDVKRPLGQSLVTIKFDNKSDLLEAIGLHEDDMWFRDMVMSSYSHYEFNDSYTIEEDFKEGYIFEYDLTEENFDTLKSIAKMVLPNEKVDFEDDEYRRKLHRLLLDIFPNQIDYILSDYQAEKDYEMNAVAREAIKSEFDDKLDEIGVEISGRNDNEVTITLADLFSESLQLNLFNENARDMITRIISNKLGSNVGGWHENSYEFRDENKFDKESFNRGVERQFEKIVETIEEKNESEYTVKDYLDFRNRVEAKFKIKTWYETPKDKDIIFSIQGFNPENMAVNLTIKDRGTTNLKDVKMDEERFIQFLHQPSLFKLEDMY
jgi:hypothetical protein